MPDCLCPLKQAACLAPLELAFLDKTKKLTFSELDHETDQLASCLQKLGIQEGSLIASAKPSIALFFAAWRLGASICSLSSRLPPAQIASCLRQLPVHLFLSDTKDLMRAPLLPVTQSLFLFTSGSTAAPKIAVLSLRALIANAASAIDALQLRPKDRWLLSLPLYHVSGIGIMIRSILARTAIVCDEQDSEITHLSWVPTQLYRATPLYKKLRCLLLGGAPVLSYPRELPCFVSYGLTEMGSIVALQKQPENGSCGHPLKGREIAIAPDGEVLVRGSSLFQGYWKEGRLDLPLDEQGWFATGDLGAYSIDRGLIILGRKDWQFISGGENIQPEEIERVLIQIEGIEEAVVVPIDDPEFGQRPIAWIQTTQLPLDEKKIRRELSHILPKYKIPAAFFTLDRMPKKNLKVDRQELAQRLRSNRIKI
jgi:O-succinylbenzoic acid--CoA ligase